MDIFEAFLWLALNIYHEARSEDMMGKKAVAHVTMNRSNNRGLGIKDVIKQKKQFSWVHKKKKYTPTKWKVYLECLKAAQEAITEVDFTDGATHYHLDTVSPSWKDDPRMKFVGKYGDHLFYRYKKLKKVKALKRKRKL